MSLWVRSQEAPDSMTNMDLVHFKASHITHIPIEKCSLLTTRASSTEDGGGTTYYKPDLRHSCCPHYTIRLDGSAFKPQKDQRKAVNRFTDYILGPDYVRLAARLCPKSREQKKHYRTSFDLTLRIHEAEYQYIKRPISPSTRKSIEPAHKFEVTLEADTFTEEKYTLFANYQRVVHKEPPSRISKAGFRSFLCSGIAQTTYEQDGKERKIGVLDLMPHCVSSVYLIYHESVNDWEFGKLSALQEIALAVEDGYQYYYMGYYIHSCTKMRYKSTFHPTYVLDPETYDWDLLDQEMLARLSACDYVSLSRERRLGINSSSSESDRQEAVASVPSTSAAPTPSSIFHTDMPGVMSIEEVKGNIPLEDVEVRLTDKTVNLARLGHWDEEEMIDSSSVQGIAAEFVACVGPALAGEIVIDLSGGA
ncbi:Arginyl-tRNA--protein transferase 1 [Xylographa trunciseda]|nr:Arginyl-tRNA--protein transferase 1 [Xylographa trunciseda]